jgi:hypothetical protein
MSSMIRKAIFQRRDSANKSDLEGILDLQSRNLLANLAPAELAGGFVMTPFTPDLLSQLLSQSGVFVAECEGEIVGYLLAGDWNFFSQWEIFRIMISRLPELRFQNRAITGENSFQYGPICIDRSIRGGEVFPQLFDFMRSNFELKFPIGVTFINKLNQRSFAAHTRKLDLEIIDEFEFNGSSFYTLAFSTVR